MTTNRLQVVLNRIVFVLLAKQGSHLHYVHVNDLVLRHEHGRHM